MGREPFCGINNVEELVYIGLPPGPIGEVGLYIDLNPNPVTPGEELVISQIGDDVLKLTSCMPTGIR